ncbi:hypothetical protein [Parvibaculum sp.]|jgi:hypothetical protein|uniref:phage head spike fiber domain-containing protein n=1 Tax=Parvibaculum sp. TaxID=2024848 RepID=UPI000C371D5C|nr:hypothetical protein [Parvibaculum sp.]MAM94831.1 hypothetical protein [Parvibaculum sp.]
MSHIARMTGFPPCGAPSWALAEPPRWRGFAAATTWWQPGDVLAFDFANSRYMREGETASLGAVLSASRTSPATWFTDAGILQPFDANIPAITDGGLYVGEQRTNLVPYSQVFDSWSKTETSAVTPNAGTAPDGTVTADKLFDPTVGTVTCRLAVTVSVASSTNYTYSCLVKPSGASWVYLAPGGGLVLGGGSTWFDVENGVVGTVSAGISASSVTALADGWYRVSVTFTSLPSSAGARVIYIAAVDADNSVTLPSDGTNGVLLWGAQLEAGSFASPPIVTAGASATRLADNLTIPGFSALASAFGFGSGFAGEAIINLTRLDGTTRAIYSAGIGNNDFLHLRIESTNAIAMFARAGSGTVFTLATTAPITTTGIKKIEFAFVPSGGGYLKVTGLAPLTGLGTFTMPPLNGARIGASVGSAYTPLNDPIQRLQQWAV